jgi:hypothetical protein
MADKNKIIIEIVTSDKGTTAAIKNNKKLDESMKKTAKSTDSAATAGRGYHATHKSIYQTNLSSAKGFSKQAESIGSGGSSGLVGAYATLAANVFAATAAFNALRGAAQVQTLIEGFTFLGNAAGQSSLQIANGLKDITNNAISLEEALRASSIALTSGFNTTQIEELGKVARNASIALGRNMGDAIDRLFRGVAKLEPEILDELGIMVRLDTATSKYAATLQKNATELTDFERRQAFLNETLTQGAMKYGDLSNAVDPNAFDKLSGSLQDLANTGLELINKFLSPFIKLLASSSGALIGGLVLFASTILTTMIPALGQMAEKQVAVANTARNMAAEQAAAGKKAAQTAKIGFVRGNNAMTTKGQDFSAVKSLKKALKSNTASTKDFNKATKQVQNTMKRTKSIAISNGKQNSKAHRARMKELKQLERQIIKTQKAQQGRKGSAGQSAIADAGALGQEGVSKSMDNIAGSGALGGFKEAAKGFKEFKKTQTEGFEGFKKGFGKPGLFKRFGMSIARGFGLGSIGVKLFGAAVMNAIPIIGQILFFGGLLISWLVSLKGEATQSEKSLENLKNTVETSGEKFKQLAETNADLAKTFDRLEDGLRETAIEAQGTKNAITVTAGVTEEARLNYERFTKALANEKDLTKSQVLLRAMGSALSDMGSIVLKVVLAPFKALIASLKFLFRVAAKLPVISHAIAAVNNALTETGPEKQQRLFNEAIKASDEELKKLKDSNDGVKDAMNDFDAGARFAELQGSINEATGELHTFDEAQKIVNKEFREMTKGSTETSENLKTLGTALQEIGKVVNKNIDGILKRNPFDKIASTVKTLNNSLDQLKSSDMLTDQQILNQLTLASSQVGVSMEDLGITLETVKANLKAGEPAYGKLQEDMEALADKTRNNAARQKELAVNVRLVNKAFSNMKAVDEYAAKLANFRKTGKFEIGAVANYDLELKAAENAKTLAEATFNLKIMQIDMEYDLELFKLKVFKAQMTKTPEATAEYNNIVSLLDKIIIKRKSLAQMDKDASDIKADGDRMGTLATAGQVGTQGERSTTAAAALNDDTNTTAGKLEAIQGATQPMLDALNQLGPEGAAVSAAFAGIMSIADAFQIAGAEGATTADKIEAVGAVVTAISAAMAANSKAQIKEIDNQIDAEKKRDGKSKESLAKIATLEKKKDQMARKAFEQGKKMKIASAIISTSAAIAGQLSADPVGPWNVALAVMMGALGMAQVAIIKKQQYQGGSSGGGASVPQEISVGKRNNRVDTSKAVTGGELSFLRGAKGQGTNANNFTPGGAAGMKRGYANGGEILVGERGPETIKPMGGGYEVTPNDALREGNTTNANFTINAVDAAGVADVLAEQRGNIIGMIREAAHEHGEEFIEAVNTNSYGGG